MGSNDKIDANLSQFQFDSHLNFPVLAPTLVELKDRSNSYH
jgi:hypothetical protein